MVDRCEHCGSLLAVDYLDMPHFTPHEHLVYTFVAKNAGCTAERLLQHLYADDPNGGPLTAKSAISVYICRINGKLAESNIPHRIVNVSRGYPAMYRLQETKTSP